MGRYLLEVFDRGGRRFGTHHCDGTYELLSQVSNAMINAMTDETVAFVTVRDSRKVSP